MIRCLLLAGLIRLLIATDKPFLCSGIYAAAVFLLGLAFGRSFSHVLLGTGISFLLASVYFWLLDRLDASSQVLWWIVAIGGFAIGFV